MRVRASKVAPSTRSRVVGWVSGVRGILTVPLCVDRVAQAGGKHAHDGVVAGVDIDGYAKPSHQLKRDEAMGKAAQRTGGMDEVFVAQVIGREHRAYDR